MDLTDFGVLQGGKLRVIQELVSGKQVTLAHVLSRPDPVVYEKIGVEPSCDYAEGAIGIVNVMPVEIGIVASDVIQKAADIKMGLIDRFTGTIIFTGRVNNVTTAMKAMLDHLKTMGYAVCPISTT